MFPPGGYLDYLTTRRLEYRYPVFPGEAGFRLYAERKCLSAVPDPMFINTKHWHRNLSLAGRVFSSSDKSLSLFGSPLKQTARTAYHVVLISCV